MFDTYKRCYINADAVVETTEQPRSTLPFFPYRVPSSRGEYCMSGIW